MILSNFWSRVVAYSGILFFVFYKLPWLHCGFYWDESWVYGPAMRAMYHHGPSMLPNAISPDLSRGHPVLFLAGGAAWMKVFGASIFSMHCFALTLSVILAIAIFEIMSQLFGNTTAFIALCLLLLNVTFFTYAAYVMTDVSIALLALLTIYCWSTNRYLAAAIFLSLLALTKESGAMLIAALVAEMLLLPSSSFSKQQILTLLSATGAMALFYCIQKIMLGWYLYPGHISAINLGWGNLNYNIMRSLRGLLIQEPIYSTLIVLLPFAIAASARRKSMKPIIPLFILSATYLVALYLSRKDVLYYIHIALMAASLALYYYRLRTAAIQHTFLRLCFTFSLLFTLFSCVNFFETRYLFPVLFIISSIVLPVFICSIYRGIPSIAGIFMILAIIAAGLWRFKAPGTDINQFGRVAIQQQLVDYIEQNHLYDVPICSSSFLDHIHLTDPNTGFLRGNDTCSHVADRLLPETRIVILDNIDGTNTYDSIRSNPYFRLERKFVCHTDAIEIWMKR